MHEDAEVVGTVFHDFTKGNFNICWCAKEKYTSRLTGNRVITPISLSISCD